MERWRHAMSPTWEIFMPMYLPNHSLGRKKNMVYGAAFRISYFFTDPDPGKSTSLEAIFDRRTIIITRIRIRNL